MICWYSKGGGIRRYGPFESQAEAVSAMRLETMPERIRIDYDLLSRRPHPLLVVIPAQTLEYPPDLFVWSEGET